MPDSSTILLVDDEESVQKLLAYPLEREGFRVLQARDGQEALDRSGSERIDLAVLDVMLPKHAARVAVGRRGLSRAEDDRRPRPASAREARARSGGARVHPHRARRRVPLPRPMNPFRSVGARLGLGLAVVVAGALVLVD